jgi:excisionase family DNA binding protein
LDQLTVTVASAKAALGIGHTTIYRLINQGKLDTIKLGRRTLVKTASIRKLVDDLEAA